MIDLKILTLCKKMSGGSDNSPKIKYIDFSYNDNLEVDCDYEMEDLFDLINSDYMLIARTTDRNDNLILPLAGYGSDYIVFSSDIWLYEQLQHCEFYFDGDFKGIDFKQIKLVEQQPS